MAVAPSSRIGAVTGLLVAMPETLQVQLHTTWQPET